MNPDGRQSTIPDIVLEQYLLGELPRNKRVETRKILDNDPGARDRLKALERSNREILEQYPPHLMSWQIMSRIEQRQSPPWWKQLLQFRPAAAWLGAAVAVVALLTVLPYDLISWRAGENASEERVKGQGPELKLYRRTNDGSEALADGTRVFQGDVVRVGYQAAGGAYGVIVSVDGRGTVTRHLPHQGDRAVPLQKNGLVLLDFALELDDAPRWERFYFVTSDAPFELAAVVRAAGQIDIESPVDRPEELELPTGLDQSVISLEKGTRQ